MCPNDFAMKQRLQTVDNRVRDSRDSGHRWLLRRRGNTGKKSVLHQVLKLVRQIETNEHYRTTENGLPCSLVK